MARSFDNSGSIQPPLQPMSVGNIVSAAFQIYRSHLKPYLGVTWRATLWILPPFLAVAALLGLAVFAGTEGQTAWFGLIVLLIPVIIGLFIYCGAKAQMNMAIISWLAYGTLTQQPATVKAGRQLLARRMWRFFWAQVLINLLMGMINAGLSIAQGVVGALLGIVSGESAIFSLVLGFLYLASLVAYAWAYAWFYARWSIPELPIAVENVSTTDTVTRSWALTQGNANRVLTVLFIGFLVTLPLYVLGFIPLLTTLIGVAPGLEDPVDPNAVISLMVAFGVSMLLLLVLNIFIVPFWQVLKSVIYYDLRSRREGIDLRLRN
jgi:hypothetical protein